jgi:hypothetical protein
MIHLDSSQRSSGTNESPVFSFTHSTMGRGINRTSGFRIVNVQIPRSYYNITSRNNTFSLSDATITPVFNVVTVPAGNYTAPMLASTLQNLMNAAGGDNHFVVTYSSVTQKITITNGTANFSITWSISPLTPMTNLASVLGFVAGIANVGSATGTNVMNININWTVTIKSVALTNGMKRYPVDGAAMAPDIMCRVPVNCAIGEVISWEPEGYWLRNLSLECVTEIDLSIQDDSGTPLDLNGLSWRITLEVY